jgi:hypothetical protein
MARSIRSTEIHRRRQRHRKLAQLRKRYGQARTEADRNALIAKAKRVSPWVTAEAFVAALPAKADKGGKGVKA